MSEAEKSPLDRALQRNLLHAMRNVYPEPLRALPEGDDRIINANLLYLEDHGFCSSGLSANLSGGYSWNGRTTITARGLDFLEDDGGLSAILGVVTVRLHADTLRALIEARIDEATLPEPQKSALRKRLADLSGVALTEAMRALVQLGLHHVPDIAVWLQTQTALS